MNKHVPAGWQVKTLEHCCDVLDSQRVPVNSIERSTRIGKYPYYGANGIQGYIDDYIFDDHLVLLAEDGGHFDEYATRPICYMVKGKCWVNNHAHILKAKNNIYTELLHYSLVHKNILTFINGGTRAKLNQSDLLEIPILLPPLPEQRKIAAVLSSADRSIAATEKLIAKLADLKKALMQQLLTKGIGHTEFKPSPLGPIPKSWEVKLLTDVISKIIDCEHKTAPFIENGKYFVVRTNSIKDGQIIFEDAKYTHEEAFREWTQREIPQPGDVLFTREAPAGEAALVPEKLPLCLGQRMVLLKFNQDVNSAFFVYSLYGSEMRKCLNDMLIGTTVSRINMADIKLINCLIPPISEQRKIADILNGVDRKLSAAKVKFAKAKDLKQGLMSDLLTGKVRVSA